MEAYELSDDERWMLQQAGASAPLLKPRRQLSTGAGGAEARESDGLDALLVEYGLLEEPATDSVVDEPEASAHPNVESAASGVQSHPEDDEIRVAVEAFERSLGIAPKTASTSFLSIDPASKVPADATASGSSVGEDWVKEALSVPVPERRWTREGLNAHIDLRHSRQAMLEARRRVFVLEWADETPPGATSVVKNFPSFVNNLKLEKKGSIAINEERELLHLTIPDQRFQVPRLEIIKQPAWSKLPAQETRDSSLRELITGARFASVANPDADLSSWFFDVPDEQVCCLSIDLPEDAAIRFLKGESGDIGSALHRGFRRRLERLQGFVEMGVVWASSSERPASITVFMMVRARGGYGYSVEQLRRSDRFYQSLLKHGVLLPPGGPIEEMGPHMAPFFSLSAAELDEQLEPKWDAAGFNVNRFEQSAVHYTPEAGYATEEELAEHAIRSRARWRRVASGFGLPVWFDRRFVGLLQDYFLHAPEHVRERQKVLDALNHGRYRSSAQRRALVSRLDRFLTKESGQQPCINYFRASPACFAALTMRSGKVLGEYWDSQHKRGKAKDLYEELRHLSAGKGVE